MRDGGARKGESTVHTPPEAGRIGSHGCVHVVLVGSPGRAGHTSKIGDVRRRQSAIIVVCEKHDDYELFLSECKRYNIMFLKRR